MNMIQRGICKEKKMVEGGSLDIYKGIVGPFLNVLENYMLLQTTFLVISADNVGPHSACI